MDQIRSQKFQKKSIDDWKEKAEQSLKGKTVESLQSTTYETITLKPLYTKKDERSISEFPGGTDFRRGTSLLGYLTNEWKIAQKIPYKTAEELSQKLEDALTKGQTAISFEISNDIADCFLECLGEKVNSYPFAINSKQFQTKLLANLSSGSQLTGYIASDPIALFTEKGTIEMEALQDWTAEIKQADHHFPNLRTVLIDTTPYHNGGANAVQELAAAAATGVYYLDKLTESGMESVRALSKMVFQFSVGANFFMELAKLRAARIIWNRITELYGVSEKDRGMQIAAETSHFTKTVYDPHVNLLRSANEAFAAVLGGVQYLHVAPFDELAGASPFSERIARNVQLILKEEALLNKVVDPAGGSWYIETLTNELAEKAWAFFQEIEANGGILEGIKTNWLKKKIAEVFTKKKQDADTRKQSIVGTNVYVNLDESVIHVKNEIVKEHAEINIIPKRRLAESFEELRGKAKVLEEQKGVPPALGLLCLGQLKQQKARLDFMKGFLSAGGIKTVESTPIFTIEEARVYLNQQPSKFICICGTNEQYELFGHEILTALKQDFPEKTFLLAGLPDKENQSQWLAEGIKQFIHVKCNCYETLAAILKALEASVDETQKA
ncbi:methylmalonyl-CoA mutase subunit beta [Neobacillus kokaensis]|uniref:Methylmalonyl-CoA mutase n=1 Tax=Neobacillus kokaensis TaxID=2759023 RepID=A0ABQ3NA84_9BACI|nr:methylmalonyl-CoA mutase subunit beta [Neobacillus kokaensis]GHI01048.1 methylmalonyl-CoA mutase [Neobacillus kokaensis]